MKYLIIIQKLADIHFEKLKKSGDKAFFKKLKQILEELEYNPKIGVGNPEPLKY